MYFVKMSDPEWNYKHNLKPSNSSFAKKYTENTWNFPEFIVIYNYGTNSVQIEHFYVVLLKVSILEESNNNMRFIII